MKPNNTIPILLLLFNRPHESRRLFRKIKEIKPKKLFIAIDGPRDNVFGEKKKCDQVKKIFENIDWECDVKRLYRLNNLGCKKAVSLAISWFFKFSNKGIILEDDCIPNNSFFTFCNEALDKYKNNEKIMHISGNNFQKRANTKVNKYYFSRYPHIWGWATWRRAWQKYDVSIKDWPLAKKAGLIRFDSFIDKLYWSTIFDMVYEGKIDTWDYQWTYSIWKNDGLCVNPGINLVKNIGWGKEATHSGKYIETPVDREMDFPVESPEKIIRNIISDDYVSKRIFRIDLFRVLYLKYRYFREQK